MLQNFRLSAAFGLIDDFVKPLAFEIGKLLGQPEIITRGALQLFVAHLRPVMSRRLALHLVYFSGTVRTVNV